MKRIQSRADLKQKILLMLGAPYINVDVSDDHLDLAIDNALRYFFKNSIYGSFESHYVYQVSAADITNGYIPVPRYIDAVVEVLPKGYAIDDLSFMSAEYQYTRNLFMDSQRYGSLSLVDFVTMRERLYDTMNVIRQPRSFEFVRYQRRLIPYFNFNEGDIIVMRCYENVDPEGADVGNTNVIPAADLWDDEVLKDLAVAETKVIWGNILKKFGQVILPGGVALDGRAIHDEGVAEIEKIKQEMIDSNPLDFFMG